MELSLTYFYTVAIVDWIPLLGPDSFKKIVLDSLEYLVKQKKIAVYGFVIMPNHIHLIWKNIAMNGREMPYVSFMKFTGHEFLKQLKNTDPQFLTKFEMMDRTDRSHQFWQTNALSVIMNDRRIIEQKLDYTHLNPLQKHWNLVTDPNDYHFSSCSFYEQGETRFEWLTHYMDLFEE
ncbi:MAG: transposase [Mucilaginibacter sp.]